MIITITGEQEFVKTSGTTVSDAKRVYVSWSKESVTTEGKYIEHKELTDKGKPFDESTNPYVSIGKVYMTKEQPIIIRKYPTDLLVSNVNSNVISATPIFDR